MSASAIVTITDLGTLCTDHGRLNLYRDGVWVAQWIVRSLPWAFATATGPEAAVEQLADEMCARATEDARRLLQAGGGENLQIVEAVRLTLLAAGYATDGIEECAQQRLIAAGRAEQVPDGAIERAVRRVVG